MRMPSRVLGRGSMVAWLGVLAGACSVEQGAAGADCIRSTECEMGLVCIDSMCTADLSLIEDPGTVPEPEPDAGMEMVEPADAAMMMMEPADAAAMMMEPVDAAAMMMDPVDAAVMAPVDGG
jgi:hypothetical protein